MQKFLVAFIVLFFAVPSFSSQAVTLKMDLTLKGKTSHPRVITNFGEKATVSSVDDSGNGYQITVLPQQISANGKPGIKLDVEIFKVEKKVPTSIATPRLTTLMGEAATLEQSGKNAFRLSVTPSL